MFKGISKKNVILMYDDANFSYVLSEILVYSEGLLKISPIWGLMESMGERKKGTSNKKLIWS